MADEGSENLKAYLQEHQLESKLNSLLNQIVLERPSEPFAWMAQQLTPIQGETVPAAADFAQDVQAARLGQHWDALMTFSATGSGSASGAKAAAPAPTPSAPAPAPAAAAAGSPPSGEGGGGGGSAVDREAKKAAKAEEKRKKEEEKERKRAEREAAQQKKAAGPEVPEVTIKNFMDYPFGQLHIRSQGTTDRKWTAVGELDPAAAGSGVWLRARLQNTRQQSAKLGFLVLRQRLCTVQVVVQGKDLCAFSCGLPAESVVDVYATISVPPTPIASCTQSGVELTAERIYAVSTAASRLPLQVEDAARSEAETEAKKLPRVKQDVRLDNRIIDLRTSASQGIFRMQSQVCCLFREHLISQGFSEIHSPKLIASASEGGADVFRLGYFDRYAYLAQSPQLYKQMALMADLGRVFEIGPVFRSEKSFTHRHMTEFVGLDMEMTFKDTYHEVLDTLEELFLHIFEGLNARCQLEIEAVRAQFPFADLKFRRPALRLKYPEAIALLREHGPAIGAEQLAALETAKAAAEAAGDDEKVKEHAKLISDMKEHLATVPGHPDLEDISTKDEKLLGCVMNRVKGVDFYVIDKFPKDLRPFYTMPDPADPKLSNSYDIFIRGEEVTSGAQRIHDSKLLLERAKELNVDLGPLNDYVTSFSYGANPHGGGGIGLERVVMLFLNLDNIRKTSMFPRDPQRTHP